MDYGQKLVQWMDEYKEVTETYKMTTSEAMTDGRKLGLFKKRNFSKHLEHFRKHLDDAKMIATEELDIPSEDEAGKLLLKNLQQSLHSFCNLCDANIIFYHMSDKKQYRGSGITMDKFKEALNLMQQALRIAVEDLEELDKAYKEYNADDFAD